MIEYCLVQNALSENSKNYIAKVHRLENKDLEDVIKYMIQEGSGLTRPQALAYFERLTQAVMHFTEEGHSVSTPLFQVRTTITGVFDDFFDSYDPKRHELNIRISSGKRMQMYSKKIKVKKVTRSLYSPWLKSFFDAVSEKEDLIATPGNIGKLEGSNLKFDPHDNRQGVFFISSEEPHTHFRAASYSGISPSSVHLLIPALPAGKYSIEVRCLSRSKKNLTSDFLYKRIEVLA